MLTLFDAIKNVPACMLIRPNVWLRCYFNVGFVLQANRNKSKPREKIDQRNNRYINDRQKCITNSLIFVSRIFFESIIEEISLLFVAVIIDRDFGVESAFSQSHLRHLVSFLIGHNQGVEEVVTSFKEHALRAFVPALKNSKNCWIKLNG